MAIKRSTSNGRSNSLILDANNFATARIEAIELTEHDEYGLRYQFTFLADGMVSPYPLKVFTATAVNATKCDFSNNPEGEYSRLTLILLALGAFNEKQLRDPKFDMTPILENLNRFIGSVVKFQVNTVTNADETSKAKNLKEKREATRRYYRPDLTTLKLISLPELKEVKDTKTQTAKAS